MLAVVLALLSALPSVQAATAQTSEQEATPLEVASAQRKAEHERIRAERAALQTQRQRDEAVCYQKFSVEDCLRGVRAQVRDAETRLRNREIALNDAERKEKAAERLRAIEEKQGAVSSAASAAGGVPGTTLRHPSRAADAATIKAQKDQDAERRALAQRDRVQAQAQEQLARNADNAERAAKARARQAEALRAADERRARVEKARADAASAGRVPAAPLPAAPLPAASAAR
ncbi:hypothetical protein [Acidovorax sp.]|uniref:hypothetical protein n=1 Tax=Acidovorax sp. TaxID=1872122 RepID=UPI003919C878